MIAETVEDGQGLKDTNFSGYTIDVLRRVADAVPFDYELILVQDLDKRRPDLTHYDEMVQLLADGVGYLHTVNVDIFACIHFRGFMKMGNFARIKIRVFLYSWLFRLT